MVRLQRRGTKKAPHHRIVVIERDRAQSGRVLEFVGHYDPGYEPPKFAVKADRIQHWVDHGAQVSPAVTKLIKHFAKAAQPAAK